jgi:8-oxo-dGTP diphosphatase
MTPPNYVAWIRAQVGHQRLLLVYVTAVVFADDDRVLVQGRADLDRPGLPGGPLMMDEDLMGCLHRQLHGEAGLHVRAIRLVGVYSHPAHRLRYPNGDLVQPWTVCFAGQVESGQPRPTKREIPGLSFHPAEETMAQLPAHHRQMLRDSLAASATPALEPVVTAPAGRPDHLQTLRRYVGAACVMLPGAVAVVRDEAGLVLAIRRRDTGTWDLPGGWCDLDETATGTAVRETREETSLRVRPSRLVGVYSNPAWIVRYPNGDQVRPVGAMFECEVIGGDLRADGEEALEVAFVDPTGRGEHPLDGSPLHTVFWHDVCHPRPEPYIR